MYCTIYGNYESKYKVDKHMPKKLYQKNIEKIKNSERIILTERYIYERWYSYDIILPENSGRIYVIYCMYEEHLRDIGVI